MERQGKRAIVLTPQGQWRALELSGRLPEVGEEIMLPPLKKKKAQHLIAAVAAVLLLVLAFPLARQSLIPAALGEPAYYIAIDINPSVELAVNNRDRVIDAQGLNCDGENLLANVSLKEETSAAAVKILANEAVRQGYFLPERQGAMLLTVTPAVANEDSMAASDQLGRKLTDVAQDIFQQAEVEAVVKTATVQPEIRRHAEAAGLSAGKYGLLVEALAAGLPLTAADLEQESASKALAKYNGNWQQLWKKLQKEKDLLQKEEQLGEKLQSAVAKGSAPQKKGRGNAKSNSRGGFPAVDKSSRPEPTKVKDNITSDKLKDKKGGGNVFSKAAGPGEVKNKDNNQLQQKGKNKSSSSNNSRKK